MPKVTENAAVRAVAERVGASAAQVGLAWLLAHRDNVLLIPGTSSLAHLEENMNVACITLTSDDIAELETDLGPAPDRARRLGRRLGSASVVSLL